MTVRLLANENFPAPSVLILRAAGYDVFSVAESCSGIEDSDVLGHAVREQRWLITFDRDYGELLFARGFPPPPVVVLLRVSSYRPDTPAQWVLRMAQDTEAYLGKFVVFDGDTIRSRPLLRPISNGSD